MRIQSGGKTIDVPVSPDQVSVRELAVAPDRQAAGWLLEMPNCCTSYPSPLSLVIYRNGQSALLRLGGHGQAIWGWTFHRGSEQVAFYTATVHGDSRPGFLLARCTDGTFDRQLGRE